MAREREDERIELLAMKKLVEELNKQLAGLHSNLRETRAELKVSMQDVASKQALIKELTHEVRTKTD